MSKSAQLQQHHHDIRPTPSHCLFLRDLSIYCTEDLLREHFAPYGQIVTLQIARSKSRKKSLCYGFLDYGCQETAIRAMESMQMKLIGGRAIKIGWACSQQSIADKESCNVDSSSVQSGIQVNQLFRLKAFDLSTEAKEEELLDLFDKFPYLISLKVKNSRPSQDSSEDLACFQYYQRKQNSIGTSDSLLTIPYALIEYSDVTSAIAAMKELNGRLYAGKRLQLSWAANAKYTQSKNKYQQGQRTVNIERDIDNENNIVRQTEKEKSIVNVNFNINKFDVDTTFSLLREEDVSLFVSFTGTQPYVIVTEDRLRQVFGAYGKVVDVAIRLTLIDKLTNVQNGYGFVYFQRERITIQEMKKVKQACEGDDEGQGQGGLDKKVVEEVYYHVEISRKFHRFLQRVMMMEMETDNNSLISATISSSSSRKENTTDSAGIISSTASSHSQQQHYPPNLLPSSSSSSSSSTLVYPLTTHQIMSSSSSSSSFSFSQQPQLPPQQPAYYYYPSLPPHQYQHQHQYQYEYSNNNTYYHYYPHIIILPTTPNNANNTILYPIHYQHHHHHLLPSYPHYNPNNNDNKNNPHNHYHRNPTHYY